MNVNDQHTKNKRFIVAGVILIVFGVLFFALENMLLHIPFLFTDPVHATRAPSPMSFEGQVLNVFLVFIGAACLLYGVNHRKEDQDIL